MKIRNGFVSNSSSSSFVFLVNPEAHKRAMAAVEDPNGWLTKIFEGAKTIKILGINVISITGYSSEEITYGALSYHDVEDALNDENDAVWKYWEEKVEPLWQQYKDNLAKTEYYEQLTDY